MSQVRTRIAAAASAAVLAGGLALGLLAGGGSAAPSADGSFLSDIVAPLVPVTAPLLLQPGTGGAHTDGTRMG